MRITERLIAFPWDNIANGLDERGWAIAGPLLTQEERDKLIAAYDRDGLFRSTVVMARHGFGQGEYRYFDYPLPEIVARLREAL